MALKWQRPIFSASCHAGLKARVTTHTWERLTLMLWLFLGGGFVSDNILYEVKFLYNLICTIFFSLLSKFTAKHSISLLTKTVINGMLERENSRIYMNYSFNVSDSVHVTLKHFFYQNTSLKEY